MHLFFWNFQCEHTTLITLCIGTHLYLVPLKVACSFSNRFSWGLLYNSQGYTCWYQNQNMTESVDFNKISQSNCVICKLLSLTLLTHLTLPYTNSSEKHRMWSHQELSSLFPIQLLASLESNYSVFVCARVCACPLGMSTALLLTNRHPWRDLLGSLSSMFS